MDTMLYIFLKKREHVIRCMSQIGVFGRFWIVYRVGGPLYGHFVSRGVACWDELLVEAVIIQGGGNVVAFSVLWREGYALGSGFMDKDYCTRGCKGSSVEIKVTEEAGLV